MADSPAGADRNLLFGVLALQLDFIGRDALIGAMNAWVLDKTRTLGAILVEQGALPSARCALLETLVAEHLRQHGDARKSLSILSSRAIADPELSAALSSIGSEGIPPLPTSGEAATIVHAPGPAGQRFDVLHAHARGGLGLVSLARDGELGREVALKEIQQEYAHDTDSRNRFVQEAEITGNLEHPGIVPVYSLGHFPDGRPYYAMRFIRGESLEKAALQYHAGQDRSRGARSLALRQLLRHFVDVCNAVAFAHARGIIHRDIKPGNVMLGQYGETLVVDWGLAKHIDRPEELPRPLEGTLRPSSGIDSDRTQPGSVLGTPSYMSPEQAAGYLDQLGPSSDIYSLGATLYVLLTGKPPIQGDSVADVLYRARRGEFPPPRQVNRAAPPALEAIVLKAMAHNPRERYEKAKDLADEVERWLADEPVKAHRESWAARLGRWGRRNRTLVAGVGALLLTTVAALSLGLLLLGKKQTETDKARRAAEDARTEADDAAGEAQQQREAALDTLRAVVTDIQARLKELQKNDQPLETEEIRRLRQELLREAIRGLRRLAKKKGSGEADHNMVRAHLDLGDLLLLDGRADEAAREFGQGRRVAAERLRASPKAPEAVADLGRALTRLGDASLQMRRGAEAAGYYQQAIDRIAPLVRREGSNLEAQRELYTACLRLGEANLTRGRPTAAAAAFRQALAAGADLERLGASGSRHAVAVARAALGKARLRGKDATGSIEELNLARGTFQALHEADKENVAALRDLAGVYDLLGEAQKQKGNAAGALLAYREFRKLTELLARLTRDSVRGQTDLARGYDKQGQAHEEALEHAAAAREYRKAVVVLEKLEGRQKGKTVVEPRWREQLQKKVERCDRAVKAVANLDWVLEQPAKQAAELLEVRARVLAKRGAHEEAARSIDEMPLQRPGHGATLYQAACCYGLCVAAVTAGKKPAEWTDEDRRLRDLYGERAVNLLRRADEAEYFKDATPAAGLAQVADLAAIRDRSDFKQLVKSLAGKKRGR